MRFLLKILFAPILAALAVVTWFLVFVVSLSSGILCIPAAFSASSVCSSSSWIPSATARGCW